MVLWCSAGDFWIPRALLYHLARFRVQGTSFKVFYDVFSYVCMTCVHEYLKTLRVPSMSQLLSGISRWEARTCLARLQRRHGRHSS